MIIRNRYVFKHNVLYLSRDWSYRINSHPKFKLTNHMQSHEQTVIIKVHLFCLLGTNLAKLAKSYHRFSTRNETY